LKPTEIADSAWKSLYRIGGAAALVVVVLLLGEIIGFIVYPPSRERVDETTVLETPVPKPSVPIQKRIIDAVNSRILEAVGLEQQHVSAIKDARELFKNFLSRM